MNSAYKTFVATSAIIMLMTACGSTKNATATTTQPAVSSKSLEGDQVAVQSVKLQGIEMEDALSEDGTQMVKRPYKWYAGIGKADNKQVAVELAQREAYATISRALSNAVSDNAERGNVANNGQVHQALTTHWEQVSTTIQRNCEPFGETVIEYNPANRMYTATARVGIRGDKFNQLLNNATNFTPSNLSNNELQQFIEANKAIMEAAKGNQ